MPGRMTPRTRFALQLAQQEADRLGHEFVDGGHILIGLLKERTGVGARVLEHFGLDLRKIRDLFEGPVSLSRSEQPDAPAPPACDVSKALADFGGVSPVSALGGQLRTLEAIERANRAMFERGCYPAGEWELKKSAAPVPVEPFDPDAPTPEMVADCGIPADFAAKRTERELGVTVGSPFVVLEPRDAPDAPHVVTGD
jgi:hypothetical protein